MPWTLRLARALGLVLTFSAAGGLVMAQAPPTKGQTRRTTPAAAPAPDDANADVEPMPARSKTTKAADTSAAKKDVADKKDAPDKAAKDKKDGPPKENPAVGRIREMLSGGGMFGQTVSPTAVLLPEPSVQKELKVEEKQKTKIAEINKALGEQRREAYQGARANGIFDPEAIAATMAEVQQEGDATINKVLTKAQRGRLMQITLQIMGPLSITNPDIATKLNLSDAQQASIEQIVEDRKLANEEARSARREMMMVSRNPDAGDKATRDLMAAEAGTTAKKAEKAAELATQKLTRLLTKKQKLALEKMMGEPFDLSKLEGTFGGRGGRGGRGGPGGWQGGGPGGGGPGGGGPGNGGPGGGPGDVGGGPGGGGAPGGGGPGGRRMRGGPNAPADKPAMDDEADAEAPAKPAKSKAAKARTNADQPPAVDNGDTAEGDDAEMPAKPAKTKPKGRTARGAAPQEN